MRRASVLTMRGLEFRKRLRPLLATPSVANLTASAIHPDQLPSLLPHLRDYGWPGDSVSTMPIRVALRLTEPEFETDTEWLLETVIVGERGAHWTPAARKVNGPSWMHFLLNGSLMRMTLRRSNLK